MSTPPAVVLDSAGEAAGMAAMVADLLQANLADSPARRRVARRARGSVVLLATDRALGVTVTFLSDAVVVAADAPGGGPGAPPALAGDWLAMAAVCAGGRAPLRALLRRELRVVPRRPLAALVAAGYVLKVPRAVARAARSGGR